MNKFMLVTFMFFLVFAIQAQENIEVISAVPLEELPKTVLILRNSSTVKVEVKINSEGQVISATPIEGHPILFQKAREAAYKWKFSKQNGGLTERTTIIEFNFNGILNRSESVDGTQRNVVYKTEGQYIKPNRMEFFVIRTELIPKIELLPRVDGKVETKYCPLHKIKMQTEVVKIIYGLTVPNKGFEDMYEAEDKLFPNANVAVYAGCIVEPTEKKEVYFCKVCRAAHSRWMKKRLQSINRKRSH